MRLFKLLPPLAKRLFKLQPFLALIDASNTIRHGVLMDSDQARRQGKKFVTGDQCSKCMMGTWNLTQENPDGCQRKF